MSNAAPTSAQVSSVIPPSSMTMAPLFTLKPSMSSVEARPPTLSSRSTTSVRNPCCDNRAAVKRPPAPAPMTTASKSLIVICCSPYSVQPSVRTRQTQRGLSDEVQNHLAAHGGGPHQSGDEPQFRQPVL